MREYVADFRNDFHGTYARTDRRIRQYYDPDSYTASQTFAGGYLKGSKGVIYRSVRTQEACIAASAP